MGLAEALGRYQYLKGKSGPYVEAIRSWITPAAAAGAFAKYLGVPSRWSIIVAVGVPILIEAAGFLLGRFLYDHGGVETEYRMALERDPYKRDALKHARETATDMRAVRIAVIALYRILIEILPRKK